MRTIISLIIVIAVLGCAANVKNIRENADEIYITYEEGIGNTKEEAIKQGLKFAIEKCIGVLIQGEVLVKNNRIINDEIISFSRGYIESYEIISENNENGLYKVRLFIQVAKNKVFEKMNKLKIINFDGEKESLNLILESEQIKNAIRITDAVCNETAKSMYMVELEKPEYKMLSDKVIVKIRGTAFLDEDFLEKKLSLLKYFKYSSYRDKVDVDDNFKFTKYLRGTEKENIKIGYLNLYGEVERVFCEKFSNTSMAILFLDKDNRIIRSEIAFSPVSYEMPNCFLIRRHIDINIEFYDMDDFKKIKNIKAEVITKAL